MTMLYVRRRESELIQPKITRVLALLFQNLVNASLTKLDASYNGMGKEGKAALQKAAEGRSGFKLML